MKLRKILLSILAFILVACMLFTGFVGCDETTDDKDDDTTQSDDDQKGTKYTVTYNGTNLAATSISAGSKLSKPTDPTKADHLFAGWYTDANYTTKATFPLTINSDTNLYAKFFSYETAFEEARANTIGTTVPGYEYDYNFNVAVTFKGIGLSGTSTGTAKYNKNSNVSYYDVKNNSGVLFYDSTQYLIRRGDQLQQISVNEDGKMTKFESAIVSSDYIVDTSSFAKALFEYTDDQLHSISKTTTTNKYELNTSFNASKAISILGNNINHPLLEKFTGGLPTTSVNTAMYVTFESDTIKTYSYEMTINVTELQLSLTYDLTFKNQGNAPSITTQTFDGISLTPAEIAASKSEIMEYFTAFKQSERSSYDFEFNSGVDYGLTTGEINATFQGSALRKLTSSKLYFHNDIEIDSDYKNADLYKSADIADVHVKKTMLSDGSVHLIEKKTLVDATEEIENYTGDDNDNYYLLDAINNIGDYAFVEKEVKNGTITYSIGVSTNGVINLLNWFDQKLDLDPLGNASQDVKIFGTFDASSISVDKAEIIVTVENGELSSIEIEIKGSYSTRFENSRDFTTSDIAAFDLSYEIEVTDDGDDFEPFTTVNAAK